MSKQKIDLEELIHTRVQLTTVHPRWNVAFIEHNGTDGIMRILYDIDRKKRYVSLLITGKKFKLFSTLTYLSINLFLSLKGKLQVTIQNN